MKDDLLSRACRIKDRRMAAAFSDPLRRRLVLLCARQPCAIAQLAELTGLDLKKLHYHVTTLTQLGLLYVAHVQKRGGRPIKFYRAVADVFFVPDELAPRSRSAALEDELRDALARLGGPAREGTLYQMTDGDGPQMRPVGSSPPDGVHGGQYWRLLPLSRADAARLGKQIDQVLQSCRTRETGPTREYLIRFAFAPRSGAKKTVKRKEAGRALR